MYNPYLRRPPEKITLKRELKRLLGSPLRFFCSVGLIVVPVLLALTGGLDSLMSLLYSLTHKGASDNRPAYFIGECLAATESTKKLCSTAAFGSITSPKKLWLYPLHQQPFLQPLEPQLYGILVIVAWLAFVAIGNPRFKQLGPLLAQVVGLPSKRRTGTAATGASPTSSAQGGPPLETEAITENGVIIPTATPDNYPTRWLVGNLVGRQWHSDPGFFYLKQPGGSLYGEKPVPYLAYALSSDMLRTNLLIVAPPGSGKTSSIYRPLIEFTRRIGGCALFFDSKGADFEGDLFDYNFDLSNPFGSFRLNLFSGATPSQAGERLGEALIPSLAEEKRYFSDVAKDAMAALVGSHVAVFGQYPELTQLLLYLAQPDDLEALAERVMYSVVGDSREEAKRLVAGLRRIIQLNESKNDILGSLTTALTPLTTGVAADLLVANPSPAHQTYTISQLLGQPGLIRVGLPVAEHPRIAPIIGRLILAQFNFEVLSSRSNTQILKLAAVDEAHNFITGTIAKGMAQARANNAGFILALQTLSQIGEKSLLDTIFAASGTKMVLAGVSDEDAERFSRTFGEIELPYVSHSASTSKSSGHGQSFAANRGQEVEFFAGGSGTEVRSSVSRGRSTSIVQHLGQSANTQLRLRRLFLASEVRTLPQYHAIIESSNAYGRRWQAQIIDMSYATVAKVQQQLEERAAKVKKKRQDKKTTAKITRPAQLAHPTGQPQPQRNSSGVTTTDPKQGWCEREVIAPAITSTTPLGNETASAFVHTSSTLMSGLVGGKYKLNEIEKGPGRVQLQAPLQPSPKAREVTTRDTSSLAGETESTPDFAKPQICESGGEAASQKPLSGLERDSQPPYCYGRPLPSPQQNQKGVEEANHSLTQQEIEGEL